MDNINEALTPQQRIKRAIIMRRNRAKIERARERSRQRLADAKKVVDRAMRAARKVVRTRMAGARGEKYEELSAAEKSQIDKIMEKKKKTIKNVALRLIQDVRKKEFERYKSFYGGEKLDHLHTESQQLLEQMILSAQQYLISEEAEHKLHQMFGDHEDLDLFKQYYVESLALEGGNVDMALVRVNLLEAVFNYKEQLLPFDYARISGACDIDESAGQGKAATRNLQTVRWSPKTYNVQGEKRQTARHASRAKTKRLMPGRAQLTSFDRKTGRVKKRRTSTNTWKYRRALGASNFSGRMQAAMGARTGKPRGHIRSGRRMRAVR